MPVKNNHLNITRTSRNGLIAKIHVAKKQLAMEDGSYRALLKRLTGKESSAKLSIADMELVLKEFARLGFRPSKKGRALLQGDAELKKIRALWLNLYHLGAIRNASEEALAQYCARMAHVDNIKWMHAKQYNAVIKGLRGWLQRIGWVHPNTDDADMIGRMRQDAVDADAIAAKLATIHAQHILLKLPPLKLEDMVYLAPHALDQIIKTLGEKCRGSAGA
jgi:phage gp16-like protein